MHEALHPRDDVDKLNVSRKDGGRGLASIEDGVDASINDSKIIYKNKMVDSLLPSETIMIHDGQQNDNN